MKRNKRTIYEIADIAKVSPATVSKVLNNREGVGADVRQRVLEIVERERFVPKMVLSDTNTIAIIYRGNEATMSLFHSEYMMHIMRGVSECVFEHGYHMVLFPSNIIPKRRDQFSLFCRKNRLAGCIWCNLRCEDTYVQDISGIIPMAIINASFVGENLYSFCSDDVTGMYEATKYLYSMGHRRISLCSNGLMYEANKNKRLGYRMALEELGIDYRTQPELDLDNFSLLRLSDQFNNLQANGQTPTALLTFNDQEAFKMISLLRLLDLPCPQKISVIGYDDYDYAEMMMPQLTTVRQQMSDMGSAAAKVLCGVSSESIDALREGKNRFVFKPSLIVRNSVRLLNNGSVKLK